MKFWRRRIGIATVLTATFGGLVAISTGTLLFLSLMSTLESTRNNLGGRLENLINDAALQSINFYQPIEQQANWLAGEIVAQRINPTNKEEFRAVLNGAVSTLPQISAISYQYPDGRGFYYEAGTNILHTVEWPRLLQVPLNRSDTNPQTRPPIEGTWVLRPSVITGVAATTFIFPARTPEGDLGVVGIQVDLNPLSRSLATDAEFRGYKLVRFLLFDNNVVIGHPLLKSMDNANRLTISEFDDEFLREIHTAERFELAVVGDIPGVETFGLETESGSRIFAVMTDETRSSGGTIQIGVHFDPEAGASEVNQLITLAVVGIALLIGSFLVAFLLGRRMASPMQQLAEAAQLVQSNNLDEVKPLPISSVRQLAAAATAFNEMVAGLKERAKIRDLFGKYVPHDVAALLLSDENTAEPRNAEATVLFLDIVGFSALSEKMAPAEVVATMNSFFSDAVEIIEAEQGMVTQFQGDAILAVFNIPITKQDHAASAIRASLSIINKMRETKYEGKLLKCRIGVNTGPLVAGAIGAQDRLSYTVYGDAVNVAARLEQMNKQFGTRILVAQGTVEQVEGYDFSRIGNLQIRGREKPVDVFTLDT